MMIFATQLSNRLLYVLQFIFKEFSQTGYQVAQTESEFVSYPGAKINYTNNPICNDEIHIIPDTFLNEINIHSFTPEVEHNGGIPVLFPLKKNKNNAWHFDLFSAIFYMLSRYEEYGSKAKDRWGRFPAKASMAHRHCFLHLPVVDIWLTELMNAIKTKHPHLTDTRKTTVTFTYDVDVAYAYKGRNLVRQAGAAMKDIMYFKPYNLAQRTAVLSGYLEDPFDTYDYILQESIHPHFFFLLSEKKTKYDRNINPQKEVLKKLIKKLHQKSEIGIHPSFYSSRQTKKITEQKRILENITGSTITRSRQHYLKFTMPHTYRALLHNSIMEDYSMSFAETPGFRAGTCTPFYFFDIEKNETTGLKIYPAPIMESTFRDDMIMAAEDALPYFIQYFEEVNKVNGHFIPIWHNDTLAANNKQHFRWLHQQILQYIRTRIEAVSHPL